MTNFPSFGAGFDRFGVAAPIVEKHPVDGYRQTKPVYSGEIQLLNWASTARSGTTVRATLKEPADRVHPLKGMVCGAQYGQRFRAVINTIESELVALETDFLGEAVLLAWGDDSSVGMSVRLLLSEADGSQGHPLQHRNAGKTGGDLLHLTLWALDDDETPQEPDKVRKRKPFSAMSAVQQSQILCRDPDFQRWLSETLPDLVQGEDFARLSRRARPGDEFAAGVIYEICGIESRSELGSESPHGEAARLKWRRLLGQYEDWRLGRH